MKERVIVLRSPRKELREAFRGIEAFRGGLEAATSEATVEVKIQVQVEEMDRREASDVARDEDVVAAAPAMPMRLIEPVDNRAVLASETAATAWGVQATGADTSPFSGAGVVVAVLDTGINMDHDAFKHVPLVQRNFTTEIGEDTNGHGTHCAGTIFGRMDGTRIGVAPGVKRALVAKVLGKGGGSSDQLVNAIEWAANEGAHVISMSLGIDFPGLVRRLQDSGMPVELATSRALEDYRMNVLLFERLASLVRIRKQPTLIIAAAGNESRRSIDSRFEIAVSPPAVAEGIVSVAALGAAPGGLKVASFSNTGAIVSGPGVDVISADFAVKDGLVSKSGTSMATPHVAGVAALWAEKIMRTAPLSSSQLANRLIGRASFDALDPEFDPRAVGAGLVQAPQA